MFSAAKRKFFYYSKSQKRGIVVLVVLLLVTQGGLLWYKTTNNEGERIGNTIFSSDEYHIKVATIDSLYLIQTVKKDTIYPFNPNFISDYKGFLFGMSKEEIDRLHNHREKNLYVNTQKEFQQVTQVSDDWMRKYGPYFKFPTWVTQQRNNVIQSRKSFFKSESPEVIVQKCINAATKEDLQKVRGIGPAYAERIIKDRERFGGFVSLEQLKFVYGIPIETVDELYKHFTLCDIPTYTLVDINEASINQIKELPYMNYYIAREVVKHRSMYGDFVNKEDLTKIENFPLDKVDIISLYLKFTN